MCWKSRQYDWYVWWSSQMRLLLLRVECHSTFASYWRGTQRLSVDRPEDNLSAHMRACFVSPSDTTGLSRETLNWVVLGKLYAVSVRLFRARFRWQLSGRAEPDLEPISRTVVCTYIADIDVDENLAAEWPTSALRSGSELKRIRKKTYIALRETKNANIARNCEISQARGRLEWTVKYVQRYTRIRAPSSFHSSHISDLCDLRKIGFSLSLFSPCHTS